MIEDSYQILNEISDVIQNSRAGFGKSRLVDCETLQSLIADLEVQLQTDYKQSNIVASNREVILNDAKTKAARIEQEARETAKQLTEENAITVSARRLAGEIEHNAKIKASQIIEAAQAEADKLTKQTEADLENKKGVTRDYIIGRISTADQLLSESLTQFDGYANVIVDILDDIRRLYDGLNGLDAFGFLDNSNSNNSSAPAAPDEAGYSDSDEPFED